MSDNHVPNTQDLPTLKPSTTEGESAMASVRTESVPQVQAVPMPELEALRATLTALSQRLAEQEELTLRLERQLIKANEALAELAYEAHEETYALTDLGHEIAKSLSPRMEVKTLEQWLGIVKEEDAELSKYLNDGWEILNISYMVVDGEACRYVMLQREQVETSPEPSKHHIDLEGLMDADDDEELVKEPDLIYDMAGNKFSVVREVILNGLEYQRRVEIANRVREEGVDALLTEWNQEALQRARQSALAVLAQGAC